MRAKVRGPKGVMCDVTERCFDFGVAIKRTLVCNTTHEVRPQLAAFTKQRDNTKRSQRLRCYRGRHEYSKTRGSRVNGRRSIAPRREWNDRHFMNREPSPIELSAARGALPGRSTRRAHSSGPPPVPAPAEVTLRPNMAARAQEVRSLPIGTSPAAAGQPTPAAGTASRSAREPACADTDIRKSARDHYLANKLFVLLSKNIRVRRRALAARSPSQHGVAHANRFPAAGRLMRAGRAGAGGGSDACAHHRPSLSADAPLSQSERDGDNSLSQRRLVNTNRPRSRDKYSTFTSQRTRARALIASRQFPTHARRSQIARGRRRAAAAPPVCYI
ncbi:hypothetical protein PYW08_013336 [Mythimna loreyi]|uniref:Uncharacterized protein n=1 Tax=Mythimna loreyi TaxID=667449 RepID=A0ACC2QJC9_9NEOP|nr:hypothetical protein PYW08_013336 [Mythimna loreyi]